MSALGIIGASVAFAALGVAVADYLAWWGARAARQRAYDHYCKLTCFGGSEKGQCSCECPADCAMRRYPEFAERRRGAASRIFEEVQGKVANDREV